MENLPSVISKNTVPVALPFTTKLVDLFRSEETIRVHWEAVEYTKIQILWGLFSYEHMRKQTFTIVGKPGYRKAVLRDLEGTGRVTVLNGRGH